VNKRVLVIEDHEENRRILRYLLESAGIEMLEAVTGDGGVAAAERERPDLILMDIQLPEVSGLQVTKWIKQDEDLKHIPVVAVTAFAMKGDEEKIREGGCEAYVAKPISVISFLQTVERFLT
jgi:two-component system cell cycle response regulator DivK